MAIIIVSSIFTVQVSQNSIEVRVQGHRATTVRSQEQSVLVVDVGMEIIPQEGVYCCFTRTTLFTAILMFTMIILVYSLKCMCIPSFILIGF